MGPHVGTLATSPPLSRGFPTLQSGEQNQNRAHMWAVWLHNPCCLGGPQCFKAGDKNNMRAHMLADWLRHPCCLQGPEHITAGNKIRIGPKSGRIGYITLAVSGVPNASKRGTKLEVGPHVARLAASPFLSRGSPLLQRTDQGTK